MVYVFWLSILLPFYAVAGYPLLLGLLSVFFRQPVYKLLPDLPVSIVVAAHNEASHIRQKILSILEQDYQSSRLEIIIASDGSNDATVEIAREFEGPRIKVLDLPRAGKTATLNEAVKHASHDILLFTDADNQWLPSTMGRLLEPFSDESVGCTAGHMIIAEQGHALSIGDCWYRHYESWIRSVENRTGCMVSADGALLALRRELMQEIPLDVNDDFFISTCAPDNHKKIIYVDNANVLDEGVDEVDKQYRRRIRVTVGGLRSLAARRGLMNPFKHGLYALALVSHKLIRRLMPLFLIPLLVSNLFIAGEHPLYMLFLLLQIAAYAMACIGLYSRCGTMFKPFRLAGFVLVTVAGMSMGCWEFLRGKEYSLWNPQQNR